MRERREEKEERVIYFYDGRKKIQRERGEKKGRKRLFGKLLS